MPALKKRVDFFNSKEGLEAQALLRSMVEDARYKTEPTYSADSTHYPDNLIPFVDKHMNYLLHHPAMSIRHYIANLQIRTRLR
jgi:hypothetical protein